MSKDLALKKISPTLYKMLDEYEADKESGKGQVCGLIIKETLLGNIAEEDLDKEVFRFGAYFEYICTGAYSDRKSIPTADTTAKGEMTAAYKQLHFLQKHYQRYFDYLTKVLGWKVLRIGYKYNGHKKATGIEDIAFLKPDGTEVVVDLKLTALFDDEYKPFGWGLERLQDKKNLILQAPWYKLLRSLETGSVPEFQFWVFNRQATEANGKPPYKIITVDVGQDRLDGLSEEIDGTYAYFHTKFINLKDSDIAKPDFTNCHGCPAANCGLRQSFPKPVQVFF